MTNPVIKIHPLPSSDTTPLKKEVGQLSLDIYHTDDQIVIVAPIAGVTKDNLYLSVTDDVLVIKGERKQREVVDEDNYYTKECFWGNFSRAVVLPEEADIKHVNAEFADNILEVRIPKSEKEHTKIIKIKS